MKFKLNDKVLVNHTAVDFNNKLIYDHAKGHIVKCGERYQEEYLYDVEFDEPLLNSATHRCLKEDWIKHV